MKTNMFETIEKNSNSNMVIRKNKEALEPIALHSITLNKYALILGYYPIKDKKYFDIYISLNRYQRVGFLSRHILSCF